MIQSDLYCQNEQRRDLVRQRQRNGLDYLDVSDNQQQLCVHFLGPVPQTLVSANVRIEGGQVIRDIQVTALELELQRDPTLDSCLRVYVDKPGDFSPYTLKLVALDAAGRPTDQPHPDFDPRYSELTFSFKVNCPNDLDCQSETVCAPASAGDAAAAADINYLAKDYGSFRQLILDRLALLIPDWQERHVPDLGITLVELLAYTGDYLSYYQDAVATEAYLDTARQRISVRRHVRLVDYPMHEGCNARTWIHIQLDGSDTFSLPLSTTYFVTAFPDAPPLGQPLTPLSLANTPPSSYHVFEPIKKNHRSLYQSHNAIRFYTWGNRECCLLAGATQATLIDGWLPADTDTPEPSPDPDCDDDAPDPPAWAGLKRKLHLQPGDRLIFEEVRGSRTGHPADADLHHRHVVCLTRVTPTVDLLRTVGELEDDDISPEFAELPVPIVEIEWAIADALPFPFCLSALGPAPVCQLLSDITLARGNVLLVDHGRTVRGDNLGQVEAQETTAVCRAEGDAAPMTLVPAPFRPTLKDSPLTFRQPLPHLGENDCGQSQLLQQNPRLALAQIVLTAIEPESPAMDSPDEPFSPTPDSGHRWMPVRDLLSSGSLDRHFVVEMDDQGRAQLRFGNGEHGQLPMAGTQFLADYRIGNGPAGNVGAETITYIVLEAQVSGVGLTPRNPLPAVGGTAPESLEEIKYFAPTAFRQDLQRAITAQDYADIVMRDFPYQVQRAAALLRWNGSWYEVLVAVDARESGVPSATLLADITAHLHRFRRMGHDIRVAAAEVVPLHIEMTVCVHPDYLRGQVKAALLEQLSNRRLANGELGFFHPDRLTFGNRIALSSLVALAQSVTGVESVEITRFDRLHSRDESVLLRGFLSLGPLEIARLDNNPNQPENGQLILTMGGGR